MCDLLWSDPSDDLDEEACFSGWGGNNRGVSYVFGSDVLNDFLQRNGLELLCRAHQVVEDGYKFFGDMRCVTLFSAPDYGGAMNNDGAIMSVSCDLQCEFHILKSASKHFTRKSIKSLYV